jgi:hypothetical protein
MLAFFQVSGQSTSDNNNTGAGKHLGYFGAQNLEFRTNNTIVIDVIKYFIVLKVLL